MASGRGFVPGMTPTGLVDVNKTWTPQQKMAAMIKGQGTTPQAAYMPDSRTMRAPLAQQQAYDASLPGGSAPAYDQMREAQRVSSLYGQGTTPGDLVAQNQQANLANFGPPVDMNTLPHGEFGRVGNPMMSGVQQFDQRIQNVMNSGQQPLTLNGMNRLMTPRSNEMNQNRSPLLNQLLQ